MPKMVQELLNIFNFEFEPEYDAKLKFAGIYTIFGFSTNYAQSLFLVYIWTFWLYLLVLA